MSRIASPIPEKWVFFSSLHLAQFHTNSNPLPRLEYHPKCEGINPEKLSTVFGRFWLFAATGKPRKPQNSLELTCPRVWLYISEKPHTWQGNFLPGKCFSSFFIFIFFGGEKPNNNKNCSSVINCNQKDVAWRWNIETYRVFYLKMVDAIKPGKNFLY